VILLGWFLLEILQLLRRDITIAERIFFTASKKHDRTRNVLVRSDFLTFGRVAKIDWA
jgi:hypothetical protein